MNVLCVTLVQQLYGQTISALFDLHPVQGGRVDKLFLEYGTGDTAPDPRERIGAKLNHARMLCLTGGYDALLTVEADNVPPPDALVKLADAQQQTGADVAYGVYVLRHPPYHWNVYELNGMIGYPLANNAPHLARQWVDNASIITCDGVGWGTTLISRRALARTPFVTTGEYHPDGKRSHADWYTAQAWSALGVMSVAHFGVLVGHITEAGPTGGRCIIWPDVSRLEESLPRMYRMEFL